MLDFTRKINGDFVVWKSFASRRPLLIRGARQVGKSHAVRSFGKEHFINLVEINFEFQQELKSIFNTLDPEEIIKNLEIILKVKITPGETLLFLDEIQVCPNAIVALRYFFERMPKLHVIAAGSLLEFILAQEKISIPVGRVQYLYMHPLSFEEYLSARNETQLLNFLYSLNIESKIPQSIHEHALKILKDYLITGGMPAVINQYINTPNVENYERMQLSLIQTYRDDFGKYANIVQHKYLEKVYLTAPGLVSKHYKYVEVDREIASRYLKEALNLLEKAGVITKILATSGHGLPLTLNEKEHIFKIIMLDVGLVQKSLGLSSAILRSENITLLNKGAIAEQFVGQQLLADGSAYEKSNLYFWERGNKSSSAEIDYLYVYEDKILPIEVKSGSTGSLKSLQLFLKEHNSPFGIRLSERSLEYREKLLSVPLYATFVLKKLIGECL